MLTSPAQSEADLANLRILQRLDVSTEAARGGIARDLDLLEKTISARHPHGSTFDLSVPDLSLSQNEAVILRPPDSPGDMGARPLGPIQPVQASSIPEAAASATSKLAADPRASLTKLEVVATEALILVRNRPCLAAAEDRVDFTDPTAAEWFDRLQFYESSVRQALASTGRIDIAGSHQGTGFVVAPGVVTTNRHVLEDIADQDPNGPWHLRAGATIDFACEPDPARDAKRFAITDVLFAGATPIGQRLNIAALDLALLAVQTVNGGGAPLPPPLPTLRDGQTTVQRACFVVGFPGRPERPVLEDGVTFDREMADAIQQIFRLKYGVKRVAPCIIDNGSGFESLQPGAITDIRRWAFTHDASTLGGSSGSAVLPFSPANVDDSPGVLGLHMAGAQRRNNYAHLLSATPLQARAEPVLNWLQDQP